MVIRIGRTVPGGVPQSLPRLLIFRADLLFAFAGGNDSVTMFAQKDFICGR
jgi:hypothetical protein